MKKRIISFIISIVFVLSCLSPMLVNAQTYEESLIAAGFPKSYASALAELHNKYPNWSFKAVDTGLDWSSAVKGERSPHSKQRIQKRSGLANAYYCNCSTCYKNGSYTVYEGSSWVGASEATVKYYLDPRNFFNEKYIFQFESTEYNSEQTQAVVESILSNSWMANANITYKTTGLSDKTYTDSNGKTVKYSKAIMDAAKNSGMSAYYLASKIVQEVGAGTRTAGGVVGTHLPFTGIYNFYSIGANSGADDGLAWAAGYLKALSDTYIYPTYSSSNDTVSGTKSKVNNGQYMCWMQTCGSYYKVRLYNELGPDSYSKDGKVGYVPRSACRTTYFNNGRPWSNPYKSIYYGASIINSGYSKYQYTDYFQKFNVLSVPGNTVHIHEYMTAVEGAASESNIKYNAYKKLNILSSKRTFYIPVYSSMPSTASPAPGTSSSSITTTTQQTTTTASTVPAKVTGLKTSANGTDYITIKWSKVSGATGYNVYRYSTSTKKYTKVKSVSSSTLSYKQTGLNAGSGYSYAVSAYNSKGTGSKSAIHATATKPKKVTILTPTTSSKHEIKVKWTALKNCTGYQVQFSRKKDFSTVIATKTVSSKNATSYTGKNFTKGVTYYVRVRAYKTGGSTKYYGSWSSVKSIKSK